jgi:hypothetical protein
LRAASNFSARAANRFALVSSGPRVLGFSIFLAPLAFLICHCSAGGGGGRQINVGEVDGAYGANVAAASGGVSMQCADAPTAV